MDTIVLIAASIAIIWKVVDGVKLRFPTLPPLAIQVIAWTCGAILAFILRESDLASAISVADKTLEHINAWTTLLFGFGLGSTSSATVDILKAADNTRTSKPGGPDPIITKTAA